MASPEVINFDQVLAPIPGEDPTGVDLRGDSSPTSPYYAIRDARAAARSSESRLLLGEGDESLSVSDWRPVLDRGLEVLTQKSKDLEITAYVIEALVRLHHFAGLRDGFRLARELVERYWDGLYPTPDEEGLATRVGPLTGLNGEEGEGTLLAPINRVPLTDPATGEHYCFTHYHDAAALSKVSDGQAREARIAQGAIPLETLERAIAASSPAFYQHMVEDLTQCLEEFGRLNAALDERAGADAPPTSEIRGALQSCLDIVKGLARDKLQAAEAAAEEPAPSADGVAAPAARVAPGAITSREEAFQTLLKVADFFRRTEPHTIVSYVLEQVVRWGRMPLPELLVELIPDEAVREALFKQVGIRPPPESTPEE